MLIRYRKNLKKIAMGLLSFMPDEKDVKKLQKTIDLYEQNDDWQLYLWKEDDVIGVIGVNVTESTLAIIEHLSVNPSFRHQGIAKKMIDELNDTFLRDYTITHSEKTNSYVKYYLDT